MHAAIFGNVAAIIQKLYASRVRYHSRSNEIKQFIRVHRIEQELSNRLEDYFHTNWSISGGRRHAGGKETHTLFYKLGYLRVSLVVAADPSFKFVKIKQAIT